MDFFSPRHADGSPRAALLLPMGKRILGPRYEALAQPYVFLSVFKWEARKAWDVLVAAYLTQFTAADAAVLLLLTNPYHSDRDFDAKVRRPITSRHGWKRGMGQRAQSSIAVTALLEYCGSRRVTCLTHYSSPQGGHLSRANSGCVSGAASIAEFAVPEA